MASNGSEAKLGFIEDKSFAISASTERIGTQTVSAIVGEINGESYVALEPVGLIGMHFVQVSASELQNAVIAKIISHPDDSGIVSIRELNVKELGAMAEEYPEYFGIYGFDDFDPNEERVIIVKYFGKTCYSSIIVEP